MTVVASRGGLSLGASRGVVPAHNSARGFPNLALPPALDIECRPADQPVGWSWICRAIAQMKPAISRAIAVVTTTLALPAAIRCR